MYSTQQTPELHAKCLHNARKLYRVSEPRVISRAYLLRPLRDGVAQQPDLYAPVYIIN